MNAHVSMPLPHDGWLPRDHQDRLWNYLRAGGKRAVAVWHRRAGKDEVMLHATAIAMMQRPGNYWHMLPTFTTARKAVWDAVNAHTGKKRIDEAFPIEMREQTRDHDMQIRFYNGSTWNVVGSDAVTSGSGIGSSTAGIVFSEYALANPEAWAYYRPILEENNGWATFISTPRGRNHLFSLFQHAARTPGWFAELLTAEDTGALSHQALAESLSEYKALYGEDMGEAQFRQEYLCDWSSAMLGAYYAREMAEVRKEGRVVECEPIEGVAIHRAWDIGVHDDTVVIWFAPHGGQLLILDVLVASGVGVEWYRDEIFKRETERGWKHGYDYVPHDAKAKEFGSGRTRIETMASMGLKPHPVPWVSFDDGINAVRRTLPLCVFHPRVEQGCIDALEQYRREWDDEKKCFRASAVHDWTSHPCDAVRYMSLAWRATPRREVKPPRQEGWVIPPPPDVKRGGIVL